MQLINQETAPSETLVKVDNLPKQLISILQEPLLFVFGIRISSQSDGKTGTNGKISLAGGLTFGLLHGFGFAGALTEVGLPPQDIPPGLLFFNVGVELGQLAFVLAIVVVMETLKRLGNQRYPRWLG